MSCFEANYLYFCEIIWSSEIDRTTNKIDLILNKIKEEFSFTADEEKLIREKISNSFLTQYNRKWQKAHRMKDKFKKQNESFLETNFKFTLEEPNQTNKNKLESCDSESKEATIGCSLKRGRPRLSYEDGSSKTKRRRAEELASKYSKEELEHALKIKEKKCNVASEGESDSETVCNEIDRNNYSNNYLNRILAMYLDLDLSKIKYDKSRVHNSIIYGDKLYPAYASVYEAKNNCYPEHIKFSKLGASVHLISLLEHTTKRILLTLKEKELDKLENRELILLGKWGMDGASGQQNTRQNWKTVDNSDIDDEDSCFSDNETMSFSDGSVFMVTFCPILLKTENQVIWSNEKPASPFFCRPIKFMFVKETDKLTMKVYNKYSSLLNKIEKYEFEFKGQLFIIKFDLYCTMIDGKVCNVLTQQKATTRCNLCGVGPKLINDVPYVTRLPCNPDIYKFGLSSLHCWIRFMEYILHVAYSLNITTGEQERDKTIKLEKKKYIQTELQSRICLPVDFVRVGAGTSNTGNVARTFFKEAETIAQVTGININLIVRLHNILQIITCKKMADYEKFRSYCFETANLCISTYPWYKMPPSLHKVLIHGCDILQTLSYPCGWFSEEPQEANNKIFKKARVHKSRMNKRISTNVDIMHYLLESSDPLISSLRIIKDKKEHDLSLEAQNLILA